MRNELDPLYTIFEQHLFNVLVEDDATEDFLAGVVQDYLEHLQSNGTVIPNSHLPSLECDLKEEVLEMLRKKTYGHYDLNAYRKANGIVPDAAKKKEKARRTGRAS